MLLLVTAAGLKTNTWFLLAVGGIGIAHNIFVAGANRRPENFGIPIDFVQVIGHPKAMRTLLELESKYKGLGKSLLAEFFPGGIRAHETQQWDELENRDKPGDKVTAPTV
jgi:hypothetical protein